MALLFFQRIATHYAALSGMISESSLGVAGLLFEETFLNK